MRTCRSAPCPFRIACYASGSGRSPKLGTMGRAVAHESLHRKQAQFIQEQVDCLPGLYGEGARKPVVRWHKGEADGSLVMPRPDYAMAVRVATLQEDPQMLTMVVRGERFRDGWRSSMTENRLVHQLPERLTAVAGVGQLQILPRSGQPIPARTANGEICEYSALLAMPFRWVRSPPKATNSMIPLP